MHSRSFMELTHDRIQVGLLAGGRLGQVYPFILLPSFSSVVPSLLHEQDC